MCGFANVFGRSRPPRVLDRVLHSRENIMRNGIRGFSLIEVLIATTIVVVALAGLAQVFVIASAASHGSKARTVATILALEKLEELLAFDEGIGGGADFIDARGQRLESGGSPPQGTAYVRRWVVEPVPGSAHDAAVLQVWVTLSTGETETVRLVGVKPRRLP